MKKWDREGNRRRGDDPIFWMEEVTSERKEETLFS
jgi:hypothetical protein